MDGLLLALIGTFVAGFAERPAGHYAALATLATRQRTGLRVAWIAIAAVNAAVAVAIGLWFNAMLAPRPRALLLGLALLLAAAGMLIPPRSTSVGAEDAGKPLRTLFTRAAPAMFGDKGQFILLAAAAWSAHPVGAAIGGIVGVAMAGEARVLLEGQTAQRLRLLRAIAAVPLLVAGTIVSWAALGLLG